MKNKNSFLYIVTVISGILMQSCSVDDKMNFNDFEIVGGFIRFQNDNPPSAIGVNQVSDLVYNFSLEDANSNVAMYDLDMYADLAGVRTDTVNVEEITAFPASRSFTADNIAGLLGVTVDDISFGDKIYFTATATTNEGIMYSGSERLGFDDEFDEISGGGVTDDLIDEAGYRQAFEFEFVILCPGVDFGSITGTYDVTSLGFSGFFGETDFDREVIIGPGENQITIVDGEYPAVGSDDLILDVNPATGAVSLATDGIVFDAALGAFDTDTYGSASGFVFTCLGQIVLTMDFNIYAGNSHPFVLVKR